MEVPVHKTRQLSAAKLFWPVVALALIGGIVLRWKALTIGFHTDDAVQVAMVRGEFPVHRSIFDLFRFADGERDGLKLIEYGYHPWWAQPDLRIAMFRPLASFLIAADVWLGADARLAHIHSFLWWAAMILAAALVVRRALKPLAAIVCIVLFTIHPSQTIPVAWLANRSTLIACTFGFLALWMHLRQHERATVGGRLSETGLFTLSLLGGEYALPGLAFVTFFELFDAQRSLRSRALALLPALLPALLIMTLRRAFNFGVRGSGYYISPIESWNAWVQIGVDRIAALLSDLVLHFPARWILDPGWFENEDHARYTVLGFGALSVIGIAIVIHLGRHAVRGRYNHLLWLGFGAILSVVPGSGAIPENRVLVFAALGAAALLGSLVASGLEAARALAPIRGRPYAAVLAVIPIVITGAYGFESVLRGRETLDAFSAATGAQERWARIARIPDAGASERRVIIINAADFTTAANLPWARWLQGFPLVKSYWRLHGAVEVHEITRLSADTLELKTLSDRIGHTMAGSLYRSARMIYRSGDTFQMDGMHVEVLAVTAGTPWRMRVRFKHSLDDPQYLFMVSQKEGLVPFKLPSVGGKMRVAGAVPAQLF